jgi:ketosteroid isomerase-like protein
MMTSSSAQTVVRRLFDDGWNSGNAEAVSDIIGDDYDSNDGGFFESGSDVPGGLRRLSGLAAFAAHIRQYQEIYDGLRFAVEKTVVDGDTVITTWEPTGTTKNETFTDRSGEQRPYRLSGQGISVTLVVDGKVTRHDMFWRRRPLSP